MRLALALGWPSVAWGLAHMGSRELTEWMAFFELEGFGDERMDIRFARLMHLLAMAHNDPKANPSGYKITDFLYPWQIPDEEEAANYEQFIEPDNDRVAVQNKQVASKRMTLKAQIG